MDRKPEALFDNYMTIIYIYNILYIYMCMIVYVCIILLNLHV